jgi:3-hexulose-6-phosphate synthase
MKLQLSFDLVTLPEAIAVLNEVVDLIDIAEVGTPFIIRDGVRSIRELRQRFPALALLADLKIVDAGEHEATLAFEAGANIVTVLGAAHDSTIRGALAAASRFDGWVMVDMIGVRNLTERAAEIDRLGVHYICVHTASDQQRMGENPADDLAVVSRVLRQAKAAVAGGITAETVARFTDLNPAIIVVGAGIMQANDKRHTTRRIREAMGWQGLRS